MSRGLLENVLKLASRKHGVSYPKIMIKDVIYPSTRVTEVGGAVKLLTLFPEDDKLSHRNALSICNIIANSPYLTPGPALTENIKDSYFKSKKQRGSPDSRSIQETHKWVETEVQRRVDEWAGVGVSRQDLLELVHRARRGGNKLNRNVYQELFKICLCIDGGNDDDRLQSMLDLVISDCGRDDAKEILFTSSFRVVTSEHKLEVVSSLFGGITTPLVYKKEQLSAAVSVDNSADNVVNIFTQYLMTSDTAPSMFMYEEIMNLCAMRYQLRWAVSIFNSMTTKYKIAPSRIVYTTLTLLMTRRLFAGSHVTSRGSHVTPRVFSGGDVSRELCHTVLTETSKVYGGKPPLWVFSEMAKPLVYLMGSEGYHTMLSKCNKALREMSIQDPKEYREALRVWRPFLYYSLIKAAVAIDNQDLGLHMLSEMKRLGYYIDSSYYILLLQLLRKPADLHSYLPVLLNNMNSDLRRSSLVFLQLQGPLAASLKGILDARLKEKRTATSSKMPGFIEAAARGLLDAALTSSSHQNCIRQLEGLAGTVCTRTEPMINVSTQIGQFEDRLSQLVSVA